MFENLIIKTLIENWSLKIENFAMKYEKSAGAIIFREGDRVEGLGASRKYLLLAHKSMGKVEKTIWDFPKGLVAEGESEAQTARREVGEETGLSEFSFINGFRESLKIFYRFEGDYINKTVIYLLAQATSNDAAISSEHIAFEWLNFPDSLEHLSFKNSRELLTKAEGFLNSGHSTDQLKLI